MESKKPIRVHYETQIFTESGFINPNGFSSLYVENIGGDSALLLNEIPLLPDGKRAFENNPGEEISDRIAVRFQGIDTNKKILVIKVYYK
jgi:hypothetical protein